jgi:hypothetical protein
MWSTNCYFLFLKKWQTSGQSAYVWSLLHDDNNVDRVRLSFWTAATNGPVFHPPGDICECNNHGVMISIGEISWFVHQSSLAILPAEISSIKAGETGWRKWLALPSIFVHTSKRCLTCRKTLRRVANGFTSPPKEGVLRIIIALRLEWTHEPWFQLQAR